MYYYDYDFYGWYPPYAPYAPYPYYNYGYSYGAPFLTGLVLGGLFF